MRYGFDLLTQAPPLDAREPIGGYAGRAERHGYDGMLLFYNHRSLDPWLLSATIMQHTSRIVPLVALQPYAVPPFTAAKMIKTLATLHGRRVDINLIVGADPNELRQVGDTTPHDERYQRAVEYIETLRRMVSSDEAIDHEGVHYRFRGLCMAAAVPPELRPRILLAGSSDAGRAAAARIADVAVTHPEPVDTFGQEFVRSLPPGLRFGLRIGLLARPSAEDAWREARARYPEDRRGLITTTLKRSSESRWSRRLANLAVEGDVYDGVYWTGAVRSGRSSLPVLVGDYAQVREYLSGYLALGATTLLVGGVESAEDFQHVDAVVAGLRAGDGPE